MSSNNSSTEMSFNSVNIDRLRQLMSSFCQQHNYKTASYWADIIVSLSNGDPKDVYQLAHCFYQCKEYHRAAYAIKIRNLHKNNLPCRHLAAKCYFAAKEYKEALEILEIDNNLHDTTVKPMEINEQISQYSEEERSWRSAIALLKGQVYEASDNRAIAVKCFKDALKINVFCYEAFHALTQHQMLTQQEETELFNQLDFNHQCTNDEKKFIKFLYETQLKKYDKPGDLKVPAEYSNLTQNNSIRTSIAERHYYNCEYQQCFKITSQILSEDIYHPQCLPIHLSCLMELKKTNLLFDLAHKLVDIYPESAISWFAVGCYYLLINKSDAARRFLSKATTLDNVFAPAWLLYGHSFAVESEHDQAMAAYFKASHLMRGCHLPLLYIGLEYGLTDNTKLAERFFSQALSIAPNDPFVLHELGVIAYQNQDYQTAENRFREALNIIKSSKDITVLPDKWEPLLNNLGHALRKLKKYEEAIAFHKQALILSPQNPSTYSALGFVYSLMTQWNEAVEYFHKALGLKRDDSFSTTMLGNAIEYLISESLPVNDDLALLSPAQMPYEQPKVIEQFLTSKENEEKSLIAKSNPKFKSSTSISQTTTIIKCDENDDMEMDISN